MATDPLTELAPGLWGWAARHPDWHPDGFGDEVCSYAAADDERLLLVDPLVPDDAVQDRLDALADGRGVDVLITLGYHVRSAEALAARHDGGIWGPRQAGRRLADPSRFTELEPGTDGPGGVRAFAAGSPPRGERPLWLPGVRAVAFGDMLVTTPDGELRLWEQDRIDDARVAWYRDRFTPTLAPLLELPVEAVLTTHGAPVLRDARARLAEALAAPPWYHRG